MAAPVEFRHYKPVNSRADLMRRVESAPEDHAEAILAGYELLEQLHDKDILNLLIGALKSRDAIINHAVSVGSSKEAVTAIRLGLMMVNKLGAIDADKMHAALNPPENPPSLFSILITMTKQLFSKDTRRMLVVMSNLLGVMGGVFAGGKKGH